MEEEDDDFYGGGAAEEDAGSVHAEVQPDSRTDKMDTDSDDEEEEDDSDDDVQFTLEKPEGGKTTSAPTTKPGPKQLDRTVSTETTRPTKSTPSTKQETTRAGSTAPTTTVKGALTHDGKEGKDFPEIRTSKIEVNGIPNWPANGKPIIEVDIDADLAEESKPWRLPGKDQTDFFNYGFDEYTWTQYCVRQQQMTATIEEQRNADAQMKALFSGGMPGGAGGGGGGGGGMSGMPGMPSMDDFMQMMNSGMMPPDFAQQMQQMGGGGMGQFPGGGGGGGGNGGGYGSGQNSVSPQPQNGQGFQPPTGPSGGSGGGPGQQQGGFPQHGMEGYSPQQMAIMQQEQQGQMHGGGGGRGRNRRGRGYY